MPENRRKSMKKRKERRLSERLKRAKENAEILLGLRRRIII